MSTKDTSKDLGTKGAPKDFDEELRKIYYDKTVNTSSAKRLKQAASDRGVKATMKQVEAFILKQSAFQKTKTFWRWSVHFKTNSILTGERVV